MVVDFPIYDVMNTISNKVFSLSQVDLFCQLGNTWFNLHFKVQTSKSVTSKSTQRVLPSTHRSRRFFRQ